MTSTETVELYRSSIQQLVAERGSSGIRAAIPVVQEVHDELAPGSLKRANLALWLQAAREVVGEVPVAAA